MLKRLCSANNLQRTLSNGDPVLAQNYLQHADHYLRRYNELNERRENSVDKIVSEEMWQQKKTLDKDFNQQMVK